VLGFTEMELNFSMFWGIAIMLYEATLISDDSPFDRNQMSADAQQGLELFNTGGAAGGGGCRFCHVLPLGSQAAQLATDPPFVTIQTVNRPNGLLEGAGNPVSTDALRDLGFFPLGVRPVAEDVGAGGTDPYGDPLSFSRKSIEAGTTARSRCHSCAMSRSRRPIFTTAAFRTCIRWSSSTGAAATDGTPA
jgi:hypothetical protein